MAKRKSDMAYTVEIRETLSRVVTVEADTAREAEEKVRNQWKSGDLVLDDDDFIECDIKII